MKKLFFVLSAMLLPVVSFAQNYNYRNVNFLENQQMMYNWIAGLPILFVIIFPILFIILAVYLFIFWIKMLIDAINHAPEKTKTVWVLVIIFLHIIGALIYYFVEKKKK